MYISGRSMYYSSSLAQHSDAPKPFILMQKMKRRIVTSKDSKMTTTMAMATTTTV